MNYINVGEVFTDLTALDAAPASTTKIRLECSCGKVVDKIAFRLKAGTAKRCRGKGHGFAITHTSLYNRWLSMVYRCHNPSHDSYSNYGGRGIFVCDSWRESFINFYLDMGDCPDGMELDRINNDGPYSPENCRWVSRSENNRNKRTNRLLTVLGETKTCQDWVEDPRSPIQSKKTLDKRLRLGWSDHDAVMVPVGVSRD